MVSHGDPVPTPVTVRINDVIVDLVQETLRDSTGARLVLRPQSFRMLAILVAYRNRLVTKEQLIDTVWRGAAVTDDSVVQCVHEIRRVLRDETRSILQTVSRRGYRLSIAVDARSGAMERTCVAVLPFATSAGQPENEPLAAVLADGIVAGLSRNRGIRVTAIRTPVRGDLRDVAAATGVGYLVGGSVRRAGGRLRITAELIEGATGFHVWARQFDEADADVLDWQDSVAQQIVGVVEPTVRKVEVERAHEFRPGRLAGYDKFLQAIPHAVANTAADGAKALELLTGALALEPDCLPAHGYAAWCHEQRYLRNGFDPAEREAALFHADIALGVNSDDSRAISIAAFVRANLTRDYDAAVGAMDRALAIDGNSSLVLGFSALVCAHSERFVRAIRDARKALWLSPADDPMNYHPYCALAVGHLFAGRFEAAARYASLATGTNPGFSVAHVYRVASLVRCGDIAAAKVAAQRLLGAVPDFSISEYARNNVFRAPLTDAIVSAIRKADLPD